MEIKEGSNKKRTMKNLNLAKDFLSFLGAKLKYYWLLVKMGAICLIVILLKMTQKWVDFLEYIYSCLE